MKKEKYILIGENIRRFRKMKDYSQENMAEELDVSLSTYARIEKGTTVLNVLQLIHLAVIFDVTVEEIIDGA